MRSSRIAQETAKFVGTLSHADYIPRRQTRSFAASLQAFTANGNSQGPGGDEVKQNGSDDDSSLSSVGSFVDIDIEDTLYSVPLASSRKRKREADSPATTVTTISSTITRTSPLKVDIKAETESDESLKKERRKPARRVTDDAGEVAIHPPSNWEEIYDAVKAMRKKVLAPVDTMGCETLAEDHLSPRDKRFQTLIALMLSSQTKDTTNAIAMRRLQTELPFPGLTLENILDVDPVKLNEMIYVVGFHNNKTRYIKAAAEILRDNFNSDIPSTIEGLMSLPGVGPKMGYLCLSAAWGRTEGIGVDVHVHRITNLWGWHKTKGPEETRTLLEGWLPRDKWHEINHLLVGFGQTICLPVGRKCGECTLAERKLCPARVVGKKKEYKRVKREVNEAGTKIAQEALVIKEEDITAAELERS